MDPATFESLPHSEQRIIEELKTPMDILNYGLYIRRRLNETFQLEAEFPFGILVTVYNPLHHVPMYIDHRAEQIARGPSERKFEDLYSRPHSSRNYFATPANQDSEGIIKYFTLQEALDLLEGIEE